MAAFVLEKMGYMLWEGLVLVCVLAGSIGLIMLRRKLSGRPAFTTHDRKLLFDSPSRAASAPTFWLRLILAVLLFCGTVTVEMLVVAPFGAAILAVSLLLSCAGIVNWTLL